MYFNCPSNQISPKLFNIPNPRHILDGGGGISGLTTGTEKNYISLLVAGLN